MPIESVIPSNHLILCHPLLPLSICPGIRTFSNESVVHIRWPKYYRFRFSISSSNEYSGLVSFRMDWVNLFAVQETQGSSPTPQFKSINSLALRFLHSPTLTSIYDYWINHSLDLSALNSVTKVFIRQKRNRQGKTMWCQRQRWELAATNQGLSATMRSS